MKMTIKTRLIFVITFLSLLLIGIGGLGLTSLASTNSTLKIMYENKVITMEALEKIVAMINENQILVSDAFGGQLSDFPEPPESIDASVLVVKDNIKNIDEMFVAYRDRAQTDEELKLIEAFDEKRKVYGFEGLLPAVAALVAHDMQQVGEILQGSLRSSYPAVRSAAEDLITYQLKSAATLYADSQARYQTVRNVAIAMIIGGVAFASFIGFVVIRAISVPLALAVDVAQSVSEGDLSRDIAVVSDDETGQLMSAMKKMTLSLSGIVSSVRSGTETMIDSSRDIAAGNGDLAKRTELQAASLQEASSSMEELTTTVKTNADHAQHANKLVSDSAEIARRGGSVVEKVVETMASIKTSSSKIEEIVSVIDGISFQTNLLALNAAVEAARAGEQGRGFAVVAGEVRNLAQRSAEAAKEIKALIEDSVSKVDAGSCLVESAGSTMREIVDSVTGVTDIMQEIASASQQQSAGIELVTNSVSHMDQMTQQNAAMVQQAAVAAENLQHQARELEKAVSIFRLADTALRSADSKTMSQPPRTHASGKQRPYSTDLSGLAMG